MKIFPNCTAVATKKWRIKCTWSCRCRWMDKPMIIALALCAVIVDCGAQRVVEKPPINGTTMSDMVVFLSDYGYVETVASGGAAQLQTGEELSEAIRLVQRVANLRETGVLDDATAEYIARPRCGVTDRGLVEKLRRESAAGLASRSRQRRYTVSAYGKWKKTTLTWTLKRSTSRVKEAVVLRELQRAFKVWSDGSGLSFVRVASSEPADIELDFYRRGHYDNNNFDGEGGVLAHAFYPITSYAGDLHFDDDENWMAHEDAKTAYGKSVSLFYVAAHELGHSLGLEHSDDPESLMKASYPGAKDIPSLPHDDLMAIQHLYGANGGDNSRPEVVTAPPPRDPRPTRRSTSRSEPTRSTSRTRSPTRPRTERTTRSPPRRQPTATASPQEVCPMTFDTIASVRGELFLFKKQNMWRINSRDEISGPSSTSGFWRGLPDDLEGVDAVYERQTGGSNIMFFSGQQYWTFDGNVLLPGYPRPLTHLGLPADLQRVDATLIWGHNGQTYFFGGNLYWRFNETFEHVESDYPREITAWQGVPDHLTSALRWKGGSTYFFKGKAFWQFDNTRMAVEHKTGRLSVPFWIECLGTAHYNSNDDDNSVHRTDTSYTLDSLKKGASESNNAWSMLHGSMQFVTISIITIMFNLIACQ